jgi:hypothetical protein
VASGLGQLLRLGRLVVLSASLTFPADLNVVEYVGQLAPGYPLESLFTACVLPTERALSDLNCAKQAVTIADF